MLNIGDTVLYGTTGVCTVESKTVREIMGERKEYFVLRPLSQDKCTVFVPCDNPAVLSKARKILSKEEILALIDSIKGEEPVWIENDAVRREELSKTLHSSDRRELMLAIRSLYLRRNMRQAEGKRLHIADERILNEAERLLHDEFSAVLGIEPEQVVPFIIKRIEE